MGRTERRTSGGTDRGDTGHVADTAFTPTQRKILDLLADGEGHDPLEIHGCLSDDLGALSNIFAHISHLRKLLRQRGKNIVCERRYRLVACDGVRG